MPSCAPNITIREREERELFTLWSRPQICSHPAAPPGQQLSRLTASFLSVKPSPICALRTVMILTHRWTSFSSTRTPQGKVFWDWKKAHLVYFVLSSSFFRPNLNRLSEPCPGRRQWKAKGAPRAPRRRQAAGGRGKDWPPPPLRPPDWFIPADRPSATAESFMTSPSRWAEIDGASMHSIKQSSSRLPQVRGLKQPIKKQVLLKRRKIPADNILHLLLPSKLKIYLFLFYKIF